MNCKLIIFDCFGVLTSEVAPIWLGRYFDDDTAEKIQNSIIVDGDKGILTADQVFKELGLIVDEPAETVFNDWLEIPTLHEDLIDYIKSLRERGFKIAFLSDSAYGYSKKIIDKYNFEPLFDSIFVSSEIGLLKSNPETFKYVLDSFKIEPENAIMVDDKQHNLDTAQKAGVKGILYKDTQSFKEILESLI